MFLYSLSYLEELQLCYKWFLAFCCWIPGSGDMASETEEMSLSLMAREINLSKTILERTFYTTFLTNWGEQDGTHSLYPSRILSRVCVQVCDVTAAGPLPLAAPCTWCSPPPAPPPPSTALTTGETVPPLLYKHYIQAVKIIKILGVLEMQICSNSPSGIIRIHDIL